MKKILRMLHQSIDMHGQKAILQMEGGMQMHCCCRFVVCIQTHLSTPVSLKILILAI